MSLPRARRGEMYRTFTPGWSWGGACPRPASRSRYTRNAASVFPDPVGATTRALRPDESAGHASSWAGVGSANGSSNHVRVRGPSSSSAFEITSRWYAASPTLRGLRARPQYQTDLTEDQGREDHAHGCEQCGNQVAGVGDRDSADTGRAAREDRQECERGHPAVPRQQQPI